MSEEVSGSAKSEEQTEPPQPPTLGEMARADLYFWLFILTGTLPIVGAVVGLEALVRLVSLIETYGFGNVPESLAPDYESIEPFVLACALAGKFGSATFFVLLLGSARAAGTRFGMRPYEWSIKATVICLFVPIANLYIPWASFAEIYEKWRHWARKGDRDWNQLGFSWATFAMVAAYFVSSGFSRYVERHPETEFDPVSPNAAREFFNLADEILAMGVIEIGLYLIAGLLAVRYLHRLRRALRQAATPDAFSSGVVWRAPRVMID